TAAPVDFGGLGSFLGEVDRALDVLDDDKKKPKMDAQRQPGSTTKPKDSTAKPKDPGRGGDRGQ
ncbi:MAG: hypothetical protein ACI9SE_004498, partial [Neolewinella sp.]